MSETNDAAAPPEEAEESPKEKKKRQAREKAGAKPSQGTLPGLEPTIDPKLERLAKEYRINRDAWMELKPDMDKARDKLEIAMTDAGMQFYETKDGYECDMRPGEPHVTVRKKKKEKADG